MISLKQRAISATLWSAVEQIGARGLSTIFMLLFARFLTAQDFGIFAAAFLLIGMSARLAVFGLNTVVVQWPELEFRALSTAFWTALGISCVMAAALIALASPVADLFGNQEIVPLIPVLALGMVAGTAAALISALLRRELKMGSLARRTLLANAVSGLMATPLVLSGLGAWGLVVQAAGGSVLTLVFTVMVIGWPIRLEFDLQVAREMLRFGAPVAGADLLTHYNRECPKLFVGVLLGIEALGLFAMGMRVMNLLLDIVAVSLTKVSLPIMSQVNRATPERLGEIYLRIVKLAGLIILPAFLLAMVLSVPLVEVMLGSRWAEIVPIMVLLCGAGLLTALNYLNGSTIVAMGRPQARFWFSSLRAVVGSTLLLVATPAGTVVAAAAFLARGVIVEPLQLLYLLRQLGQNLHGYVSELRSAIVASTVMVMAAMFAQALLIGTSAITVMLGAGTVAAASYGAVIYLFDKPLLAELRGLASSRGKVA